MKKNELPFKIKVVFAPLFVSVVFICGAFGVVTSCGSKDSDDNSQAGNTPTKAPTTKPTATPTLVPVVDTVSSDFFIGSSTLRTFVRFDTKGTFKTPWIDFKSSYGTDGGVVAYAALNEVNKLVAFDPSATTKTESIALIDPVSGLVRNKSWFVDPALSQVTITGMSTGLISNTLLVGTSDKVLRVLYDSNLASSGSASDFLTPTTLANCPHTIIENINFIKKDDKKTLIVLSSGANTRINLVTLAAGAPNCAASFDYAAPGGPTTAADVPVNSVLMADGSLYILFQNPTASKIVKYTYTGVAISNPVVAFSDQTLLGAKPKALFGRSSLRLLFGNTTDDKIYEISTAGIFTGFFLDNSFTQDVSLIVAP